MELPHHHHQELVHHHLAAGHSKVPVLLGPELPEVLLDQRQGLELMDQGLERLLDLALDLGPCVASCLS